MTNSDEQAAHDRAYLGGMRYIRLPSTPPPDIKKQRAEWNYKRAAEEDARRDGIPVERNHQMTYTREYVAPTLSVLHQQIAECQKVISFYQEQLKRMASFPDSYSDKAIHKLNLRNAEKRLILLQEELHQQQSGQ